LESPALAPLLANSRENRAAQHAAVLQCRVLPIIYYGDEIGMGDNFLSRRSQRLPTRCSGARTATQDFQEQNPPASFICRSRSTRESLRSVNVGEPPENLSYVALWIAAVIAMRKISSISRGSLEFLYPDNPEGSHLPRR